MSYRERLQAVEAELATLGCGDHGCCVARPKGMGTNGGCRCLGNPHLTPDQRTKIRRVLFLRQEQVQLLKHLAGGADVVCR
jgi:hypothetical protein